MVMMEWNAKTYFVWRGVDYWNLYVQGGEGMFAASMELYSTTELLDFSLKKRLFGPHVGVFSFIFHFSFVYRTCCYT